MSNYVPGEMLNSKEIRLDSTTFRYHLERSHVFYTSAFFTLQVSQNARKGALVFMPAGERRCVGTNKQNKETHKNKQQTKSQNQPRTNACEVHSLPENHPSPAVGFSRFLIRGRRLCPEDSQIFLKMSRLLAEKKSREELFLSDKVLPV